MKEKYLYIMFGLVLIVGIIYLIVIKVYSDDSDKTEPISCGNGRTVYRFKYPTKAYPVLARDYEANFKITTDLLNRIVDSAGHIDLSLDAKNKVIELQEKLNQDNITFTTGLRSYFFAYNNDPCNEGLQSKNAAFIDSMTIRMLELRKFIVQTTRNDQKGSAIIDTSRQTPLVLERDPSALLKGIENLSSTIHVQ